MLNRSECDPNVWTIDPVTSPPAAGRRRNWQIGLVTAVLVYAAFLALLAVRPMRNDFGEPVSPFHKVERANDIAFYESTLGTYRTLGLGGLLARFADAITQVTRHPIREVDWRRYWLSGPVFPVLLALFDYRAGHTLPLALAYFVLAVLYAGAWLYWMAARGLPRVWLMGFVLLPSPAWYMVTISTDLLFATLFVLFYLTSVADRSQTGSARSSLGLLGVALLLLLGLTRPNALSLVSFVLLHQAYRLANKAARPAHVAVCAGLLLLLLFYYLPYVLATYTIGASGTIYTYFGRPVTSFTDPGLFPDLPGLINRAASLCALAGAKTLYFVGLRPSYSQQGWLIVLIRSAPGLVLLPGLIRLFWRERGSERLLVAFFFVPMLFGPAQDRYNLPIQALLYYHGALAWTAAWRGILGPSSTVCPPSGAGNSSGRR